MAAAPYRYCPRCGKELQNAERGGKPRLVCPDAACGYVFWDNPAPVVAAIVEYEGQVLLVRNVAWPENWYGLVTGFLEKGEKPEQAVLRELKEETGLDAAEAHYIGAYTFGQMNQLILAYHVEAQGNIQLDPAELADYRLLDIKKVQPWPMGTGIALRDWLRSRGYERDFMPMPGRPKTQGT